VNAGRESFGSRRSSRAFEAAWALTVLLFLAGCDGSAHAGAGSRTAREARQRERFPLGEVFIDLVSPESPRPFPESLSLLEPAIGRGVSVPLDVVRPDGSREAPRWGLWTYEYVRVEWGTTPSGEPTCIFGDIDETSTGLESQGEFARSEPTGLWRFWYPDGTPRAEGSFNEGQLSGPWSFWRPDGTLDPERSGAYSGGAKVAETGR